MKQTEQQWHEPQGPENTIMPPWRWEYLQKNEQAHLTSAEIAAGWHFCYDWDGLLVGPGMQELEVCQCKKETTP